MLSTYIGVCFPRGTFSNANGALQHGVHLTPTSVFSPFAVQTSANMPVKHDAMGHHSRNGVNPKSITYYVLTSSDTALFGFEPRRPRQLPSS